MLKTAKFVVGVFVLALAAPAFVAGFVMAAWTGGFHAGGDQADRLGDWLDL